jgi:hypothetical protein
MHASLRILSTASEAGFTLTELDAEKGPVSGDVNTDKESRPPERCALTVEESPEG